MRTLNAQEVAQRLVDAMSTAEQIETLAALFAHLGSVVIAGVMMATMPESDIKTIRDRIDA